MTGTGNRHTAGDIERWLNQSRDQGHSLTYHAGSGDATFSWGEYIKACQYGLKSHLPYHYPNVADLIRMSRGAACGNLSRGPRRSICLLQWASTMVNSIIKKLRKEAGLTQEEVARRARTPRAYISQIENGIRSPSERLAEDILMKGIGLTYSRARRITNQWKLQKAGLPQELEPMAETRFVAIPILCSIPCGEPGEAYDDADGYISLPASKIPEGHRIFAVMADGLSMLGEDIAPGDIIICDPDAEVKDGDLGIVKLKGGFTLKRVYFRDGYVRLEPANRGFKPVEASRLKIVARVIYIIKKC